MITNSNLHHGSSIRSPSALAPPSVLISGLGDHTATPSPKSIFEGARIDARHQDRKVLAESSRETRKRASFVVTKGDVLIT